METPELTAFIARSLHDQECLCHNFENHHHKSYVRQYNELAKLIIEQLTSLIAYKVTGFANGGLPNHQQNVDIKIEPNLQTSAEAIADVLNKSYKTSEPYASKNR